MILLSRLISSILFSKTVANLVFFYFFSAGADIKEMKDKTYAQCVNEGFLKSWDVVSQIRKPVIAAVNGYAVGICLHVFEKNIWC